MSEQSYSTTFTVGALFHSESVRVIAEMEEYEREALLEVIRKGNRIQI